MMAWVSCHQFSPKKRKGKGLKNNVKKVLLDLKHIRTLKLKEYLESVPAPPKILYEFLFRNFHTIENS
jgi:hypothetical protein